MSNVYTNELDAASGQSILIPQGYNLSLGGTILNSSSIPPDPEDQEGKYLVSNNTDAIFRHIGPTSIQTFYSSGTWNRPEGINRIIVRVVGDGIDGREAGMDGLDNRVGVGCVRVRRHRGVCLFSHWGRDRPIVCQWCSTEASARGLCSCGSRGLSTIYIVCFALPPV